jgi:hypothetical protein
VGMKQGSLSSLQTRLIKGGGRLVRHARRLVFQLAEVLVSGKCWPVCWNGLLDSPGSRIDHFSGVGIGRTGSSRTNRPPKGRLGPGRGVLGGYAFQRGGKPHDSGVMQ